MLLPMLHQAWGTPVQVVVTIALVVHLLGVAALAGIAALVVLFSGNITLQTTQGMAIQSYFQTKDIRLSKIREAMQGMIFQPPLLTRMSVHTFSRSVSKST